MSMLLTTFARTVRRRLDGQNYEANLQLSLDVVRTLHEVQKTVLAQELGINVDEEDEDLIDFALAERLLLVANNRHESVLDLTEPALNLTSSDRTASTLG